MYIYIYTHTWIYIWYILIIRSSRVWYIFTHLQMHVCARVCVLICVFACCSFCVRYRNWGVFTEFVSWPCYVLVMLCSRYVMFSLCYVLVISCYVMFLLCYVLVISCYVMFLLYLVMLCSLSEQTNALDSLKHIGSIPHVLLKLLRNSDLFIFLFFILFFLRDFIFKKTLFEKLQYLKQEQ